MTFGLGELKSEGNRQYYSGSGVVNENETETKRKRSINGFFEMRFDFFETFECLANEMAQTVSD